MAREADDQRYQLSLIGPDITINKEVDQRVAAAIVRVVFGSVAEIADLMTGDVVGPEDSMNGLKRNRRLSPREAIESASARTNPAKIAVIGRYLRDCENQDDFSRDEIKARFRAAGESLPSNFPRDFQSVIQAGWIAEDHQKKGRFYVTARGDEAVETRFENAAVGKSKRRRRVAPAGRPDESL